MVFDINMRQFRLKRPIGAVLEPDRPEGAGLFQTIPRNAIIEVVSETQDRKTIEVKWNGTICRLFRIDLEQGATQIWP